MSAGTIAALCLTLAALAVTGLRFRALGRQDPRPPSLFRQACRALYPDFTWPETNRDITQTLHMLFAWMGVLALILLVWSVGAGAMRAAWLLSDKTVESRWLAHPHCSQYGCDLRIGAFTLFQIARAFGGILLISVGAWMVGGIFGFLFGIPTKLTGNDKTGAGAYQLSTNLTRISERLTTGVIGVGLVEAKTFYITFVAASASVANWLFQSRNGSPAVVTAALASGTVAGFIFFYLYAQLILSRLINSAERSLAMPEGATLLLGKIGALSRKLVPPIRRTLNPNDEVALPTQDELKAAIKYYAVSFADLIADPAVGDDDILSWARARCILNQYREAVPAYLFLYERSNP